MVQSVAVRANLKLMGSLGFGNNESSFPQGTLGEVRLVNNGLYAYLTVNGLSTWFPLIRNLSASYVHAQGLASDRWTINHNLGVADLWYQIQGSDGNYMSPASVEKSTDNNTLYLNFTEAVTGTALIVGANSIDVPGINAQILNIGTVRITDGTITVNGVPVLTSTQLATYVDNALVSAVAALNPSSIGLGNVNNTSDVNKPVSTAQAAADAATLASAQSYADGLIVGLWNDRGNYDASTNVFPSTGGSGTAGAIAKGDIWTVSVAGTVGGVLVNPRETIRALINNPGQTANNWAIGLANTDIVDSVTSGVTSSAPTQNAVASAISAAVAGIAPQVQSNWTAVSGVAAILNKPTIPSKVSDLTNDLGFITTQYSLGAATASVLGGVKIGANVSVAGDGTISVAAPVTTLPWTAITSKPNTLAGFGITLVSGDITGALGFTPYNNSNPSGYQTSSQVNAAITAAAYSLPIASTTVLGGVKVDGTTVTISNGVISAPPAYTLPTASTTVLGGVKVDGTTITITGGVISSAGGAGGAFALTQSNQTTAYSVVAADNGKMLTNMGATGSVTFTLPAASSVVGKSFEFQKVVNQNMVIAAVGTDTIQDSSAAGTLTNSSDTDACVVIRAVQVSATPTYKWHIVSGFGTWVTA
jgi:hypothetical protein